MPKNKTKNETCTFVAIVESNQDVFSPVLLASNIFDLLDGKIASPCFTVKSVMLEDRSVSVMRNCVTDCTDRDENGISLDKYTDSDEFFSDYVCGNSAIVADIDEEQYRYLRAHAAMLMAVAQDFYNHTTAKDTDGAEWIAVEKAVDFMLEHKPDIEPIKLSKDNESKEYCRNLIKRCGLSCDSFIPGCETWFIRGLNKIVDYLALIRTTTGIRDDKELMQTFIRHYMFGDITDDDMCAVLREWVIDKIDLSNL